MKYDCTGDHIMIHQSMTGCSRFKGANACTVATVRKGCNICCGTVWNNSVNDDSITQGICKVAMPGASNKVSCRESLGNTLG